MTKEFDPYHKWLGIQPKDQPPNHYRLLGLELFENDREVIDAAANRVMSYLRDLAIGDNTGHSQRLLNQVAQARLCLLKPAKRNAYDAGLRSRTWQQLGYRREQIEHLLTGVNWFERGFGTHRKCDLQAMRQAWGQLRDGLLAQWIVDNPGTRPAAWWHFDAPEPRQRIDGKTHPFADPLRTVEVDRLAAGADERTKYYELAFGIPRLRIASIPDDLNAEYEGQLTYLTRLELFTEAERTLLGSRAPTHTYP